MSEKVAKEILAKLNKQYDFNNDNSLIFKEFKFVLEDLLENKNINCLIDYTHKIYEKIIWDKEIKDIIVVNANRDYKTILIHLLNIFIAKNRIANIDDFDNTPMEFKRIVNIIEGFRRL